ncbi:MAG: DNA-packaging protein [Candidatus Sabulitectum sp.]|nr:DNA-packaging protein [Candidatus Sabulitectum sp.]
MSEAINAACRKLECQIDGLYFMRYFFKQRFGSKMIISGHHKVIQDALDRTMLPPDDPKFISRLIINVSPGYTKTEMASINYMARGLAINPMARFLHLSYSDKLVLLNSGITREIVKSAAYQSMWPVTVKADTDSKKIWHTDKNGGITATAAGGQVTGFRAGHMDPDRFTGALIIDDPVKPDDAYSETIREAVNNGYNETIASRVALETVPIIVIMQRIHWSDLAGYLLRGGSGEKWHHLNLPIIIDNEDEYPDEYTHGIPMPHNLPNGWLWPFKHNAKHEVALRAHRRKFAAQCMQKPLKRDEETALWTEKLIATARANKQTEEPKRTLVSVDPATTNTEVSDEHGIIVGSEYPGDRYSLDADYTRKGSPKTWADATVAAYNQNDADAVVIETNQGGDMCETTLRNAGYKGKIIRVTAKKGKTLRAEPVVALYEQGQVWHKAGMGKAEDEMMDFDPVTQKSNGKSPNRVDALTQLLSELSGVSDNFADLLQLAIGKG